jgi:hypothetical protein
VNQRGGPIGGSIFNQRHWQPARRAVGLEGLRFHDLRHTAVALAISQGAHPKAIQRRMGYSTINITLDRYGHLFPELDERLADGIGAALEDAQVSSGVRSAGSPDQEPVLRRAARGRETKSSAQLKTEARLAPDDPQVVPERWTSHPLIFPKTSRRVPFAAVAAGSPARNWQPPATWRGGLRGAGSR